METRGKLGKWNVTFSQEPPPIVDRRQDQCRDSSPLEHLPRVTAPGIVLDVNKNVNKMAIVYGARIDITRHLRTRNSARWTKYKSKKIMFEHALISDPGLYARADRYRCGNRDVLQVQKHGTHCVILVYKYCTTCVDKHWQQHAPLGLASHWLSPWLVAPPPACATEVPGVGVQIWYTSLRGGKLPVYTSTIYLFIYNYTQ